MLSCPNFGPLLFFSQRRRGAPRGGGEEEALVQTKMDPCFYKMVLCYMVSMAEVWCRLECPLLLFPLPLPWCAHYPLLLHYSLLLLTFAKRAPGVGSKAGAEAPGLGRFKEIGFLREGGNRNQVPQKRCFCGSPIIKNAPGEMNSPCAKVLACGQNACDGALAPGPRSGLLLHSSLLLLTSAKRARGPGPGRPRGSQVCRRFAPRRRSRRPKDDTAVVAPSVGCADSSPCGGAERRVNSE